MTLQEAIIKYMAENAKEWTHSGQLERMEWKYLKKMRRQWVVAKPGTVGRTLRLLEEKKILAVQHPQGSAQYRYIPSDWREKYRPFQVRLSEGNVEKLWL